MTAYPVHYSVAQPVRFDRLQLLVRLVAFCALGLLGLSFGVVFFFAYLALPVFAASRLTQERGASAYAAQEGPRVITALRWLASVSAWAALVADRLPGRAPEENVLLTVEGTTRPTAASAIWRVISGLPSALVLAILGWIGVLVWIWAAVSVLLFERVGPGAFDYLVGLQRWSIRLLAYQASLVDEYPPFSFADSSAGTAPPALPMPGAQA